MTEQTTQTIGKTKAIVISNFKNTGHSAHDKISNLLRREAETNYANRLDNADKARYTRQTIAV